MTNHIKILEDSLYEQFTLAERVSLEAVVDTYMACRKLRPDYKRMTALVIVLKHKMLEHHEKGTVEYCLLYFGLWDHEDNYCHDTLKGDELAYFLEETDAIN